ncbi:hypothetical protein JCGZ_26537 [Jatropha curcas]|uniref:Uncharacterized protein n=1 Tax=Jatropha curcas TaxID=180498 RepID=A0A067L839_JATCU|nr:hypothetical protein JCGZ_26537 [Jatropha curcas]
MLISHTLKRVENPPQRVKRKPRSKAFQAYSSLLIRWSKERSISSSHDFLATVDGDLRTDRRVSGKAPRGRITSSSCESWHHSLIFDWYALRPNSKFFGHHGFVRAVSDTVGQVWGDRCPRVHLMPSMLIILDTDRGSKVKDPLALPVGPITRARATKLRAALNAFAQEQITL